MAAQAPLTLGGPVRDEWFIVRVGGGRYVGRHRTEEEAMTQVRCLIAGTEKPLAHITDPSGNICLIEVIHTTDTHMEASVWSSGDAARSANSK